MAMKKFINDPANLTKELLEGLALCYSGKVKLVNEKIVTRAVPKDEGKVAVVTLGGAGHEPALSGFVGEGMLDASVVGDIFAAPGAQALINLLPRLLPGQRVGILGPTYEEHEASWRRAGRDVRACASLDELVACDIGVIVNPNNPTGRIVPRENLLALARRLPLVVDESFADFSSQASIAAAGRSIGDARLR